MDHNILTIIFFAAGVLVAAALVAFLCKKQVIETAFDERQERVIGISYKYAFWTLVVSLGVYAAVSELTELPMGPSVSAVLLICLSVTVWAIISIRNDAYMGINKNPRRYLLIMGAMGFVNLAIGAHAVIDGTIMENGKLALSACNLICAVMCIIIFFFLATCRRDKSVEDE